MVPSAGGPYFAGGCGRYPDSPPVVAAGTVGNAGRSDAQIAAHELGHNMNRAHTPGCGAGRPDPGYPVPIGNLDDTGIDILRGQVYKNNMSLDFMSYCGSESTWWVSSYTYRALINAFGYPAYTFQQGENVLANPSSLTPIEFMTGSGFISPSGVKITHGFYKLSLVPDPENNPAPGPYSVELQDATGKNLSSLTFLPANEDNVLSNSGPFHIRIPWVEGATSLVFKYNGSEIGRRQASEGVPQVTLLTPNGGESWGQDGTQTITWTGSDPDGDKLTYIVEYSNDNGVTWETLAANVVDTRLDIQDISGFSGSNAALIRVIASDGFNTAQALSNEPFSVAGKGPSVHISSPMQEASASFGSPIILWAMGTDPEDGPLGEGAFTWSSNRDGALGSGSLLVNQTLSVGKHVITLTGKDADGNLASETVNIEITGEVFPNDQVPVNAGNPKMGIWLIPGVAVILLGGLLLFLVRRRRNHE
jgi:hypothetical protein